MKKQNEFGRSMLEMLGVLAVIGILTISSISAYDFARNTIGLNKLSEVMNYLALSIQEEKPIYEKLRNEEGKFTVTGTEITSLFVKTYNIKHQQNDLTSGLIPLGSKNLKFQINLTGEKINIRLYFYYSGGNNHFQKKVLDRMGQTIKSNEFLRKRFATINTNLGQDGSTNPNYTTNTLIDNVIETVKSKIDRSSNIVSMIQFEFIY